MVSRCQKERVIAATEKNAPKIAVSFTYLQYVQQFMWILSTISN